MAPSQASHHRIYPATAISRSRIRKPKSSGRAMKQIFRSLRFSFAGTFDQDWTYDKMAKWVRAHGGEYTPTVDAETTHLICTVKEYCSKPTSAQVKKALALGRRCHIVVGDWLEDCLTTPNRAKRRRAEKGYSLSRVLKRIKQTAAAQRRYRDSFEAGVQASHELVDNTLNHIYMDQEGFEYKVVCTRIIPAGRIRVEKYTLYLFESHAKPCHYMFGAKLTSLGRSPSYHRADCHPKHFHSAFADFKKYFLQRTGVHWDERLEPIIHDPTKFRYTPPQMGRPVGVLPHGVLKPWERVQIGSDASASSGSASSETSESGDSSETSSRADSGIDGMIYDTDSDIEDESADAEDEDEDAQ